MIYALPGWGRGHKYALLKGLNGVGAVWRVVQMTRDDFEIRVAQNYANVCTHFEQTFLLRFILFFVMIFIFANIDRIFI